MTNLTQTEWEERLAADKDAIILDVRTQAECNLGMQEHARCIDIFDRESFIRTVDRLDKSGNYYVYCRSGNRSSMACSLMEEMGFRHIYNLIGGMMNWHGKVILP